MFFIFSFGGFRKVLRIPDQATVIAPDLEDIQPIPQSKDGAKTHILQREQTAGPNMEVEAPVATSGRRPRSPDDSLSQDGPSQPKYRNTQHPMPPPPPPPLVTRTSPEQGIPNTPPCTPRSSEAGRGQVDRTSTRRQRSPPSPGMGLSQPYMEEETEECTHSKGGAKQPRREQGHIRPPPPPPGRRDRMKGGNTKDHGQGSMGNKGTKGNWGIRLEEYEDTASDSTSWSTWPSTTSTGGRGLEGKASVPPGRPPGLAVESGGRYQDGGKSAHSGKSRSSWDHESRHQGDRWDDTPHRRQDRTHMMEVDSESNPWGRAGQRQLQSDWNHGSAWHDHGWQRSTSYDSGWAEGWDNVDRSYEQPGDSPWTGYDGRSWAHHRDYHGNRDCGEWERW